MWVKHVGVVAVLIALNLRDDTGHFLGFCSHREGNSFLFCLNNLEFNLGR